MSNNKAQIDVTATDHTRGALTSVQKNVKKTSKEADTLAMRFRNVARATVVMDGPLGGVAGRFSALATMMGSVSLGMIAAGVGVAGMTATMISSLKTFASWEVQTLKIDQLLKQTGGTAGITGGEIEEMALRIGRATLLSANDVRDASAMLLSFKSIGVDAFERVLSVGADVQALAGGGLKDAIKQLGKALEDPATGLSALRRAGVSFTMQQRDMIVAMHETGKGAEAQVEILKILEGQLGGAAAAQGKGLAGAADLVSENWTNMLVTLSSTGAGSAASDLLTKLGNQLEALALILNPTLAMRYADALKGVTDAEELLSQQKGKGEELFARSIANRESDVVAAKKQLTLMQIEVDAHYAAIKAAREKGRVAREEADKMKVIEDAALAQKIAREKQLEDLKKRGLPTNEIEAAAYVAQQIKQANLMVFVNGLAEKERLTMEYNEALMAEEKRKADEIMTINDTIAASFASGVGQSVASVIVDNQNLADAAKSLLKNVTKEIIASYVTLAIKRAFFATQATAASIIESRILAGTWASPAYLASVATLGSAAEVGSVALALGMAEAQVTANAGKEHGGNVLGGRTYLVGENGPELRTDSRTGQIINNKTLNSLGGNTNNINVTVLNEPDDKYIERNQQKIWDGILGMMNENGLSFG